MVTDSDMVSVGESSIHSTGLFATKDIAQGTKIIEFKGERITKEEAVRRLEVGGEKSDLMHVFELDDDYDIDGGVGGNESIYFNHSCDPNCEVDIIDGEIWFFAEKDVKEGDELTFDYSTAFDVEILKEGCGCGSGKCRGTKVNEEDLKTVKELVKDDMDEDKLKQIVKIADEENVSEDDIKEIRRFFGFEEV